MSKTIDERVVSLEFDNKRFEQNVSTTMSTLDKLKKSLNLSGASKGLEQVDSAAKRIDMSGLSGAVDTVRERFSALQVMGITALANITNSAVNAGKRIASALTIDPIKTGLSEYETQINAVQTILANTESKGTTLKDVNGALDTLNTYADKTIYNFTEMTRNIGTFTAAGVDLDTSVNAIQGIANLAAVSGSSSQQASTAMYQLSQALASGTVKLMDWNSVVNAGMGGQVFQDALKETARVHGVNIDQMIKKNGSFRETLQEGWLTSEILTETLEKFTMTTEGLTEAEIEANKAKLKNLGYTDKQIEGIFKLGDTATQAATKVKTASQLFDTLKETAQSGWTQTWEILLGDFEEAKSLFSDLYETLAPILEASAKVRNELLQGWKDAGGRADLIDTMKNVFEGIGNVVKPIKEAFREIFPPTTVDQLVGFTKGLKNLSEQFKNFFASGSDNSENLKRTFKGLFAIFDIGKQVIGAVFKAISPLFGQFGNLSGGVLGLTAKWGDWLVKLSETIESSKILDKAVDYIHKAFKKIGDILEPVADGIKEFSKSIADSFNDISSNATERLGPLAVLGNFIKSVFVGAGNIVKKVAPYVSAAATGIGNVLHDLMDKISSSFQNADYDSLFDLANGGIITAIGVFIAKFIKSGGDILDNAGGFLENINGILEGVGDALGSFSESLKADTLKKVAIAIGILAASLLVLSLIDSEKLTLSLIAISTLFAELMGSMAVFGKIADSGSFKGITKLTFALITMSAALLILSAALKIMSTMSWKEMGVGLISLTVSIGLLVGAVNLLPEGKVNKAAKAIKKMSTALLVLAVAIKIMSTMSWEEMGIGLISMVVGLGALVGAVNLLPKDTMLRAAGMMGLATAMVVLSAALKIMATMSWSEIARSLVTLSGSLLILAAAMRLMRGAIPGALAMLVIAPALVVLASALKVMATMSWGEIARGLVVLAGALIIIAGAMALMKGALPGAGALLVITAALTILTPVLKALGSMGLDEIGKSLLMLAGVFTIFGLAALVLKPLVPTMLALAGAIALLGIACAAIGAGVLALGVGLTAIAASGSAAAIALVTIVSSIISLVPYLIEQIGVGIIKLCEVIAGGSAAICDAATVLILALVDALVASIPALVEGAFVLIDALLESLVNHTPTIVGAIFDFLIGVINAIAEKLPDLIQAGVNLVMALFSGIVDALKTIDPSVLVNGLLAVGLMSALMTALAAMALLVPAAMIGVLGMGTVITELAIVLAAIGAIAQIPGLNWLIGEGGQFLQTIGTAIGQFVGGIVGGFAQGMTSSLPQIGSDLSSFMTNAADFIDGVKSIDASAMEGAKSLVGVILALTAADILSGLTSWITGGSSLTQFGEELAAFAPNLKTYADTVAGIDASAVEASANAAKTLSELATNLPNSGGLAGWFAGENDIGTFGEQLVPFGEGMKAYSDAIVGFNAEAVVASANAAKALADMTSHIPNEGGMVAWFAGENSISNFGTELVALGDSLSAYSLSIIGFNADAVVASANAAKALADMTSHIPNEGGIAAWFAGENSVASFSNQLVTLGEGLSAYSLSIAGFNADAVVASANAAKALVDMTSHIPNEGGMVAWFAGENSVASFSSSLVKLGDGLSGFSTSIEGINADNITAAANAAKALAQMASYIPNEGGMVAWFTGENSVSKFAGRLPALGKGLKGFSTSIEGINTTNITAAAKAAKTLAQMADTAPKNTNNLKSFGENLVTFGGKLKSYFDKVSSVSGEVMNASSKAIKAISDAATNLNPSGLKSASSAIDEMVKAMKSMSKIKASSVDGFTSAVKKLGETNVEALVKAFKDAGPKMKTAGQDVIKRFVEGAESQNGKMSKAGQTAVNKFIDAVSKRGSAAKSACAKLVSTCASAIGSSSGKFKSAGVNVVKGFANGISLNKYIAANAARAMAAAAAEAAKKELKEHSPSRVFYGIGDYAGVAFVNALGDYVGEAGKTGSTLAKSSIDGLKDAMSLVTDIVNSDIDAQPTIRPVLDLTNVKSGANSIGSMLNGRRTISVDTRYIDAVAASMGGRQNGGGNDDIVKAIKDLRKDLADTPRNNYNINGLSYGDDNAVTNAIVALITALKLEGRA